jgi:hypothetical protein
MMWLPVFLVVSFILIMMAAAGCTQPATPVAEPAASSSSLGGYALTAADAPANYTFIKGRAKTSEEIGDLAKSLGWQGGYEASYAGMANNPAGGTLIVQTITMYPEERMAEIVALADAGERSDSDLTYTILTAPDLGENSRAFSGTAGGAIVHRDSTGNPLAPASMAGTVRQDVVGIIFSKGSNLVVLKMTGPDTDYATLSALAEKAYVKLP